MAAGPRRTPLWIQSPVESTNARGELVVTAYVTLQLWWAERVRAQGSEAFTGQQFHGARAIAFRGGFLPGITVTAKMVLATANVTTLTGVTRYDIQAANDPDGRRRDLDIIAIERGV